MNEQDSYEEIPQLIEEFDESTLDKAKHELMEKINSTLEQVRGVGKNDPCPCLKRRPGAPPPKTNNEGKLVRDGHWVKFKNCCLPKIQQLRRIKLQQNF